MAKRKRFILISSIVLPVCILLVLLAIFRGAKIPPFGCSYLGDWDPIDGPRYRLENLSWAADSEALRFTIIRNAYWPCGIARTYIAAVDGSSTRQLEIGEQHKWDGAADQSTLQIRPNTSDSETRCAITYSSPEPTYSRAPTPIPAPGEVQAHTGMDPVLLGYPESADKVTCSPDQRYGVFSQKDGEDWTLSIMEVATGEIRLLSEGNSPFSRPKWSPDGGSLAFTAGGDLDALFESDVTRRSTHMLISGVVLHDFFWLPDGDRLLYMLGGVQKGVYLVKAHPPGVKKLIVGHSPSHFLVSPSGQKLVGWNCCPWVGRDLDLIVIDLKDENAVVLISDSLIKSLDDQAYDHCAPEDCRW